MPSSEDPGPVVAAPPAPDALKRLFLLDPEVVFLNHGSYGATPRPVFDAYQAWQRELERQPVRFLGRDLPGRLAEAREPLAGLLGASPDDLAFVPNATFAVNQIARSLRLGPGDEVLGTDLEYGACDRLWAFGAQRRGFRYRRVHVPLPAGDGETATRLLREVTPATRLLFVSHLTSATAQRLPVEAIVAGARDRGVPVLVDGAHAPGQLPLALDALGADLYIGNLHKWAMAPKGAAFLHVRRDRQGWIEPLVVSWGFDEGAARGPATFRAERDWLGTHDPAAYLSVPAAVAFARDHRWEEVRARCHALLAGALARLEGLTGRPAPYRSADDYRQMAVAPLPGGVDANALQRALYERWRIEVPVTEHGGRAFVRVSVQGYNARADLDALHAALEAELARAPS